MNERQLMAITAELRTLEKRVTELEERLSKGAGETRDGGTYAEIVSACGLAMGKEKAAKAIGVTRATVYTMIKDGRLAELPDGRISARSIADYLDGKTNGFKSFKRQTRGEKHRA